MREEKALARATTQTRRRDLIEAALVGIGGLAASGIFPGTSGQVYAAAADPSARRAQRRQFVGTATAAQRCARFHEGWLQAIVRTLVCVVAILASTVATAQTPCTSGAGTTCRDRITLENGWRIPYWRNYAITTANSQVVRAVIVVHGSAHNPNEYFGHIVASAQSAGKLTSTLIIAPYFQVAGEVGQTKAGAPAPNELVWKSNHLWRHGDPSLNGGGVSSFAVMDQIVNRVADRGLFPNLTRIVVTGHSAGGIFMNRYASGSRAQTSHTTHLFHYIIGNSASYLYLDSVRPVLSDPDMTKFSIPNTSCAYDKYPYGLGSLNPYMSAVGSSTIRSQYRSRRVTYFLGGADTEPPGGDSSCKAAFQGHNTLERGSWFFRYIQTFMPTSTHDKVVVPGVGHDAGGMYTSSQGQSLLFQ